MNDQFKPAINSKKGLESFDQANYYIAVKPYSLKEICRIYGTSYKVMNNWLKPIVNKIGEKRGRFFSARQVEIIILHLGVPYSLNEK